MAPVGDSRKMQSEFWLRTALLELIVEKGFERVTIIDLCKRAGVNRGTFYLHYADKYELYDAMKQEKWDGLMHLFQQSHPREIVEQTDTDLPNPIPLRICRYFFEHADFFRVIFGPNGDPRFVQRFREQVSNMIAERFRGMSEMTARLPAPPHYLIAYVINANLGLVKHWLEDECSLSPEEVALMLTRIMKNGPLSLN